MLSPKDPPEHLCDFTLGGLPEYLNVIQPDSTQTHATPPQREATAGDIVCRVIEVCRTREVLNCDKDDKCGPLLAYMCHFD